MLERYTQGEHIYIIKSGLKLGSEFPFNTYKDETALENVLRPVSNLKDKVDALAVEIILKQIEATRNRVIEIFRRLTNGNEKSFNLNRLRSSNHITEEQYHKLSIASHTLPSISKILMGKGLYSSRK